MKRRQFLQGMAAASAVALPGARTAFTQQPATPTPTPTPIPTPVPVTPPPHPFSDLPKVEFAIHEAAGQTAPRFFNDQQFAALRKLSDTLMPPVNDSPGALDADAPEFLDFFIGASPPDRQQIYRVGLDKLNKESAKRFNQPFAQLNAVQAAALLAPLREPWTFEPPTDALARFLRDAKRDVRNATINSREWTTARAERGSRVGRRGWYWYPLD